MSSRITSLGLVTGSTNTQSSYIWTIWNGKDYKVSYNDLGKFVGRNPGLQTSAWSVSYQVVSGTIISWGDSPVFDYLGWWDANSNNMVQVKDDKVTHVEARFSCMMFGTGWTRIALFNNGTKVDSVSRYEVEQRNDGGYPVTCTCWGAQFPVSSGDLLTVRFTQLSGTNTLESTSRTFLSIKPVRYKQ